MERGRKRSRVAALLMMLILVVALPLGAYADDSSSSGAAWETLIEDSMQAGQPWSEVADRIDLYLDNAFEAFLAGDTEKAYDWVNNAYFRVYETTGFERQTMNYVSGSRKNAVELQFSTCKAEVKKDSSDTEQQKTTRTALAKLKSMIREDGNKLAALQGQEQSETKYYVNGELVDSDPYAELSGDPNAAQEYANWVAAAQATNELLDTSYTGYKGQGAQNLTNDTSALDNLQTAYYAVYEESGLSHEIYQQLSIADREEMDQAFQDAKTIITGDKYQPSALQRQYRKVKNLLLAKAEAIDEIEHPEGETEEVGETEAAGETVTTTQPNLRWSTFLAAFGIIVREGLEAILVIAAIIAYLVKSGNQKSLKNVYLGSVIGIAASFLAALILYYVKLLVVGAGQSQELIEGITALIAVCVLFYVSNWMISKSEAAAWSAYIDSQVQSSVEKGSAFALSFTAFLSVFREGAEVVLFYQPMLGEGNASMVWAGFLVGCVVLVFVYLAITKLSIRLPIKVFFTATSILMAVMCVSFLGSGIKELSEAGVFDVTMYVQGIPENDVIQIFGIYPYLETLIPQLILAIILVITFLMAHYRQKLMIKDKEITKLTNQVKSLGGTVEETGTVEDRNKENRKNSKKK